MTIPEPVPGPYVYLLSTYGEYGAENVMATLRREDLPAMLAELLAKKDWVDADRRDERALAAVLLEMDEDLAMNNGRDISFGWGGVQLHVVRLRS